MLAVEQVQLVCYVRLVSCEVQMCPAEEQWLYCCRNGESGALGQGGVVQTGAEQCG